MLNQTNKILKSLFIAFACSILVTDVYGYANTQIKTGWNSGGNANSNTINIDNAILGGCKSDSFQAGCSGAHNQRDVVVLSIARQLDDLCGYFCPTQIEFWNFNNGQALTWNTLFYNPLSYTCKWMCKEGYKSSGTTVTDNGNVCGVTDFKKLKYADIRKSQTSYIKSPKVPVFKDEKDSSWNFTTEVLALVDWYNHGALATRVTIKGKRTGDYTYINSVAASGSEKFLLCDMGYKPNSGKTDCEPIAPSKCGLPPTGYEFCNGWSEEEYKRTTSGTLISNIVRRATKINTQTQSKVYTIVGTGDEACIQYRCADDNYGFISAADRTCVSCTGDPRKGVLDTSDAEAGVCKICKLGEYFDKDDKTIPCKSATALTKSELQYGVGMSTHNIVDIKQQCWTKLSPDEYRTCLFESHEIVGDDSHMEEFNTIVSNPNLTIEQKIKMLEKLRGFDEGMDEKVDKAIQNLKESQN